jgi:tagaturonate reductase
MAPPVLQFGTGRFLQAHVDLFVSEALDQGRALGGICVVQGSGSAESARRLRAMAERRGFPVRIRGQVDGRTVDRELTVHSVHEALSAQADWPAVRERAVQAQVVVSNTADAGFQLDPRDDAQLLREPRRVPASYPARLLVLLFHRWTEAGPRPITVLPTELVSRNGATLQALVLGLARQWHAPPPFVQYLEEGCVWADSLVDRIVSEPLQPVGAVAEPYALWAIERQPGLTLPCEHPAIVLTDDLREHERLKLFVLNLGHSCLAELWLQRGSPSDSATVREAMQQPALREPLESIWADEVMPVFDALGLGGTARRYLQTVRERFDNPFLRHAIADIAQHHDEKKRRRLGGLLALADELGLPPRQRRLRQWLPS